MKGIDMWLVPFYYSYIFYTNIFGEIKVKDVVKENYTLLLGDCLERMKEIPDGSVDVCISDIPYGIDF